MTDVLPAGGGDVVAAFPDAATTGSSPLRSGATAAGGDSVVTATANGVVRVFDSRTGALRRSFGAGRPIATAALTPDRATIALGGPDGRVQLFSLATGELVRTIDHVGVVLSVAFSNDGRYHASAGTNETAKIWDAGTGVLLHRLSHPRAVRSATFSPDNGRLLTLSSDRFVRVFDVQTGRQVARLDQGDTPTAAVFAPGGGRIVTTGQDELPHIWKADTGKLLVTLEGHSGNVLGAAYAPDGKRLATASTDGQRASGTPRPVGSSCSSSAIRASSKRSRSARTAARYSRPAATDSAGLERPHGRTAVAVPRASRSRDRCRVRHGRTLGAHRERGWDGTHWSLGAEPVLRELAAGPSAITSVACPGSAQSWPRAAPTGPLLRGRKEAA